MTIIVVVVVFLYILFSFLLFSLLVCSLCPVVVVVIAVAAAGIAKRLVVRERDGNRHKIRRVEENVDELCCEAYRCFFCYHLLFPSPWW